MEVTRVAVALPGGRDYEIVIDANAGAETRFAEALAPIARGRVALVCDRTIDRLHRERYERALQPTGKLAPTVVLDDGEGSKSFATLERIVDAWSAAGLDRGATVIALGGGVIGDVVGFAAAIYLRGIAYVQVPTTLLAQVDSSVGGKTAINLAAGKNLVGAFHQPRLVYTDVATLATLSARDRAAGAAEALKHGVIADADYLAWIEHEAEAISRGEAGVLAALVARSCRLKAEVVAGDERETAASGGRARLNFGHTIGHAIEARSHATGEALRHGEAVALGMLAAARVGVVLGAGDAALEARLDALYAKLSLPRDLERWLTPETLALARGDKKRQDLTHRFVVVPRVGQSELRSVSQDRLEEILRR